MTDNNIQNIIHLPLKRILQEMFLELNVYHTRVTYCLYKKDPERLNL